MEGSLICGAQVHTDMLISTVISSVMDGGRD